MISLPSIVEKNVTDYLTTSYTGAYNILRKFSTEEFTTPCIIAGASNFSELEPNTGVFNGTLSMAVITQIDDIECPLVTHDNTVNTVYHLIAEGLQEAFNTSGAGHLWAIHTANLQQDRQDRTLISVIEFSIVAQTLPV